MVCKHILKKLFTSLDGLSGEHSGVESAGLALETGHKFRLVVGHAVPPTAPHDALPFERQCPDRGVMAFARLEERRVGKECRL